jgi:hypothetical protein
MDTARLIDSSSIPSKAGLREKCPAPAAEAGLKKTETRFLEKWKAVSEFICVFGLAGSVPKEALSLNLINYQPNNK